MIYFSNFAASAPAPADIAFAVQDVATGTATGSTSYTSATITGLTPAATLLIGSVHAIANDPNETAEATFSWGTFDGSSQMQIGARSRDNQASTSVARRASAARAFEVVDGVGTQIKVATGSHVSGGFSLNYSTNDATDRRAMAVSFAGANITAKTAAIALGTGTTAIDVNTVGFQPDAVIFYGHCDSTNTAFMSYTFGFATADGTQRGVIAVENNAAAAGAPIQAIRTDSVGGQVASAALTYKLTVSDFDASGFSITPNASAGSDNINYLALKFTGGACKIVDFTTPTATGSSTIIGAGFTPRFALVVLTNLEATDTHVATSDLQSGLGIAFVGDEQWATSWRIDSGADPTDTASQCSNAAIMGASATDCDAILASFTAWTSDGMTVNYSAVQGTGKKGFVLFIQ